MSTMKHAPGHSGLAAVIGEPSFADAIAAIACAPDLSPDRRRHWATSLRQLARYLDRPLATLPARITAISGAVAKLHPEVLGVNAKTFANHRANAKAALLWFTRQSPAGARKAPMATAHRTLWEQIEDRYARDSLSPFFRFLSGLGVSPEDVRDDHVAGYMSYRREISFANVTASHHRVLVRHWNSCADDVPGWPASRLTEPARSRRVSGPQWQDFPAGLAHDIEAWCDSLARRRKSANGRTLRPCKPSTIDTRRRELVAAVRAAVAAGIPLAELDSLAALLHPERVEIVIDHYWRKNGERPSGYTIDLAFKFMSAARAQPGYPAHHLDRLEEIRAALEDYRTNGLTEKNRALVRKVIRSQAWKKVVHLPARVIAQARASRKQQPIKAAVAAELGIAIRLLTIAPVRMQNLAAIRLGTNLVRPGGPGTPFTLIFPGYDVKNGLDLEFELDHETTVLIDEYVHDHRPHLLRGRNHDYLFPGKQRDCKGSQTLSEQISKRLWKHLGLQVTPHQFRHAAAALILMREPGNYELVRRVLGHRNIQTTINFYVGLETLAATRRFGEIVAGMEARQLP